MITIKVSADNERLFKNAVSPAELRGAVDLVLERIEQAYAAKVAAKAEEVKVKEVNPYNWRQIGAALQEELGVDVRSPPYPDPIWYQRVQRFAKMYDLQGDRVKLLAEAVKASYLKQPYSLDFLVTNAGRILDGGFKKGWEQAGTSGAARRTPRLPSLPSD